MVGRLARSFEVGGAADRRSRVVVSEFGGMEARVLVVDLPGGRGGFWRGAGRGRPVWVADWVGMLAMGLAGFESWLVTGDGIGGGCRAGEAVGGL